MQCLKAFHRPHTSRPRPMRFRALATAGVLASLITMAQTAGVQKFYDTGENPYKGDAQALAEGKELFDMYCQACHLPDGSGRIGPSLIGDTHHYPRFTTDKGI